MCQWSSAVQKPFADLCGIGIFAIVYILKQELFFLCTDKIVKVSTGLGGSKNLHWRHYQGCILGNYEKGFSKTSFENYQKVINSTIPLNKKQKFCSEEKLAETYFGTFDNYIVLFTTNNSYIWHNIWQQVSPHLTHLQRKEWKKPSVSEIFWFFFAEH